MTCQVCLSACKVCQNRQRQPHMLEHSMTLSGVIWRCRQGHRMDADPVDVMTANGARRMF